MISQLRGRSGKFLLWLLALALLVFVASMSPGIREHLPWFGSRTPDSEADRN